MKDEFVQLRTSERAKECDSRFAQSEFESEFALYPYAHIFEYESRDRISIEIFNSMRVSHEISDQGRNLFTVRLSEVYW